MKLLELKEKKMFMIPLQVWHGMTDAEAETRESFLISLINSMNENLLNQQASLNACKVNLSVEEHIELAFYWLNCCCKSFFLTGLHKRPFPVDEEDGGSENEEGGIDEDKGDIDEDKGGSKEEEGGSEEDDDLF